MSSSPFKVVTIVGATGNLGYHIAEAFLDDGSYKVKVLRRKPENENEKSKLLASRGAEILYADYSQKDDLVKALKGTDALVSVVSTDKGSISSIQSSLLAAAKEANVKRFGAHVFTDDKIKFQKELEECGIEYTFIYNGLFQEYLTWFAYDVKDKRATFYVDDSTKIFCTSWLDIGKYTVESLKIPEARNAHIQVAGAVLTLKELLQKFEKASGGSKWKVVEDKDLRKRYENQIHPVPTLLDYFKLVIMENMSFDKLDNDKFSFNPRSIDEVVNFLVKNE
nr:2681_t:CDS:2 [Entrophospora candida]